MAGLLGLDLSDPQVGLALGLLTQRMGQGGAGPLILQFQQQQEMARQRALQQQLMQQQLQSGGIDLKAKTQSFEDSQAARDVLRNMKPGQPPAEPDAAMVPAMRPVQGPGGGAMAAPTQTVPNTSQPPGATGSGKNQTFLFYKNIGDQMASKGLPEQAQKYYDLAEKYRPKLKDTKTLTDPNTQQRVTVNFYEDGSREVVPYGPDQEKAHFADVGGQVLPLDPFTGAPRGQGQAKTVSPDTIYSGGVTMRGQNMTDARAQQGLGIKQAELAYNTGLGAGNYNFPQPSVPGVDLSGMAPSARSQVASDIAKKGGEAAQQARIDLPNVAAQTQQTIKLVDELVNHPGFSGTVGAKTPFGAAAAIGYGIPGTDAADFMARRNQIVGQQFMQAYQTLKGGGQITEVEGKKATDAISRMSTSQSEAEFKRAADDFKQVLQAGLQRARTKAGVSQTGFRYLGTE